MVDKLHFPFMLQFSYKYVDPYTGDTITPTQKECFIMTMDIEKSIPADKYINEKLINDLIGGIDSIQASFRQIKEFLVKWTPKILIGCIISWLVVFITLWQTKISVYITNNFAASGTLGAVGFLANTAKLKAALNDLAPYQYYPEGKDEENCGKVLKDHEFCKDTTCTAENEPARLTKCKATLGSLRTFNTVWSLSHWICDRVACPNAPTMFSHVAGYKDIITGSTKSNCCKADNLGTATAPSGNTAPPAATTGTPVGGGVCRQAFSTLKPSEQDTSYLYSMEEYQKAGGEGADAAISACKSEYESTWNSVCVLPFGEELGFLGDAFHSEYFKATKYRLGKDLAKGWCESPFVPIVGNSQNEVIAQYTNLKCEGNIKLNKVSKPKGDSTDINQQGCVDLYTQQYGHPPEGCQYAVSNGVLYNLDCKVEGDSRVLYPKQVTDEAEKKQVLDSNSDLKKQMDAKKDQVVEKPTSGIITAFRCGCLTSILGFVNQWTNILQAIKTCLVSLKDKKEITAGMCHAVLTQYLCDLIYQAIGCIVQLAGAGLGARQEATNAEGGPNAFGLLYDAGSSVSDAVSNRYGATTMYNVMFNQKKLVYSICLAAFTGDWDFEGMFDSMVSDFVTAQDSTVMIYPAERTYITSSPLSPELGRATYSYHFAAMISAGADIDYQIFLVCSNDNSCGRFAGGDTACDCNPTKGSKLGKQEIPLTRWGINGARATRPSGRLTQGQLLNDEWYVTVSGKDGFGVRFDKILVRYTYNTGREIKTGEFAKDISESPSSSPPVTCQWSILFGEFKCSFAIGNTVDAWFDPLPKIKSTDSFGIGATVPFEYTIKKLSPGKTETQSASSSDVPVWVITGDKGSVWKSCKN